MNAEFLGFSSWLFFRILFISLIVIYIIGGLDDLIIDAVYYLRSAYRHLFRRRAVQPVTVEALAALPEKPIAILIPAWEEANVIGSMLLKTCSHLLYKNYHVFVGTYPNDDATRLEVDRIREIFPNIDVVITPSDGPTNKADCLNWICQGVAHFEKEHGVEFQVYVFHDAEDVVHPLSLRWYNYLMPRVDFIQVPVFPLEQAWHKFTAGLYGDEFAETHTKDLRAREVISASVPSAGVGTALSRAAMAYLARERKNQIFDITSLTEDYMMAILLKDMPGRKIFLQQEYEQVVDRPHPVTGRMRKVKIRDWVATREFFPDTLKSSVRQRSRWVLGISLQGWKAGWAKQLGLNYCLYRDRKSILTNLVVVPGYAVVLYWAATQFAEMLQLGYLSTPLMTREDPLFFLLYIVGGLFFWRLFNRFLAVRRIYGWRHAFLSIPRFFWGNLVNFYATCAAIHRYVAAKRAGKVPEWGKTAHAFPTEAQLVHFHRKLGDLLLERRMVTTEQLKSAIAVQKESGGKLGEILIRMGALWEEDLVKALASQNEETAVELDPSGTPAELLARVPAEVAHRYRVFPVQALETGMRLATDATDRRMLATKLEAVLATHIELQPTSSADIDFALLRCYAGGKPSAAPAAAADRLGERLIQRGVLKPEDLQIALRRQKRSNRRLGDILLEMHLVPENVLREEHAR